MRVRYARMVELTNEGARELGFHDAGEIWKSQYDMPAEDYEKEVDRLWQQLQPFYASLHAYVRAQLVKKYGQGTVPPKGPIPAQLLGNLWSQEWNNIANLMDPPKAPQSYDLTKILQDRKTDARGMVKYGENFFISLGFAPLPQTFGSVLYSQNPPIGKWFVMPAPGTSTTRMTCASRSACIQRRKTS
jgi:peptidyl-dipeptidase A